MPAKVLLDVGFETDAVGSFPMYKGRGCSTCNGTGYKGRVGLYEVLEINDAIRELIMMGANSVELRKKAHRRGHADPAHERSREDQAGHHHHRGSPPRDRALEGTEQELGPAPRGRTGPTVVTRG